MDFILGLLVSVVLIPINLGIIKVVVELNYEYLYPMVFVMFMISAVLIGGWIVGFIYTVESVLAFISGVSVSVFLNITMKLMFILYVIKTNKIKTNNTYNAKSYNE